MLIAGSIVTMIIQNSEAARIPARHPRTLTLAHHNPKIIRFETTDPHPVLYACDNFFMFFFTVELALRWYVAAERREFFKYFINAIELVVLVPKWIVFVLSLIALQGFSHPHQPIQYWLYFLFSLCIVFRIVRLMKVCRYYSRMTILFLTIKASTTEISFLLYLLGIVSVLFGVSVYYAELWEPDSFKDIPTAVYWACMTMNVVGYGDIVPSSTFGEGIAIMCCLCGVLFTGLAVPIISSNFRQYYEHMLPLQVRQRRGNSICEVMKMAGARRRTFSVAHETSKLLNRRRDREESNFSSMSLVQDAQSQYTVMHETLLRMREYDTYDA